jgi:hypothetical protein
MIEQPQVRTAPDGEKHTHRRKNQGEDYVLAVMRLHALSAVEMPKCVLAFAAAKCIYCSGGSDAVGGRSSGVKRMTPDWSVKKLLIPVWPNVTGRATIEYVSADVRS